MGIASWLGAVRRHHQESYSDDKHQPDRLGLTHGQTRTVSEQGSRAARRIIEQS